MTNDLNDELDEMVELAKGEKADLPMDEGELGLLLTHLLLEYLEEGWDHNQYIITLEGDPENPNTSKSPPLPMDVNVGEMLRAMGREAGTLRDDIFGVILLTEAWAASREVFREHKSLQDAPPAQRRELKIATAVFRNMATLNANLDKETGATEIMPRAGAAAEMRARIPSALFTFLTGTDPEV